MSPDGLSLLRQWEGLRLVAYPDSGGRWAIGYGHTTSEVHQGLTITQEQADTWLVQDVQVAMDCVDNNVLVSLSTSQADCLGSFVYNVGTDAFEGSTLLRKLNAGNYAAVPDELAKWNHVEKDGKHVVDPGLVNRRAAECGLWAKGSHVASQDVQPVNPKPMETVEKTANVGVAAGAAGTVLADAAAQVQTFGAASHVAFWLFLALAAAAAGLKIYAILKKKT